MLKLYFWSFQGFCAVWKAILNHVYWQHVHRFRFPQRQNLFLHQVDWIIIVFWKRNLHCQDRACSNHRSLKVGNLWGKINIGYLIEDTEKSQFLRSGVVYSSKFKDGLLYYNLLQLGAKYWTSNFQMISWYFM